MVITENKKYLFEKMKVPKAVMYLVVPTIISQLITIIYNWADVFFVGQLNDTFQMAAITICYPAFMMTTALSNLLGIGGASVISRALGNNNYDKIKKTATLSLLLSIIFSIVYSLFMFLLNDPLLYLLGADKDTIGFAKDYLFWVVILGSLPSVTNYTLSHLIRSIGKSQSASIGIAMGGIINIILDPIFIFVFNLDVTGAAIATCISNCLACAYFIIYLIVTKKDSLLNFSFKNLKVRDKVLLDSLASGLSGFFLTLMALFSNASINHLMSTYSAAAISGVNIAKKVDLCVVAFAQGFAQGVLPLIGYNFASKDTKRMNAVIKFSLFVSILFAVICVILFSLLPRPIVNIFIKDEQTVEFATDFLRILCLSMPLTTLIFLFNTIFQATQQTTRAMITILLRKGIIDIPIMIFLNHLIPIYGIVISQPLVDCSASIVAIILYITFLRKQKAQLTPII